MGWKRPKAIYQNVSSTFPRFKKILKCMTKKERQLRQKEARANGKYSEGNRVTAVRFTEPNLSGLTELAQKNGITRNRLINEAVTNFLCMTSVK